jgi:ribose transport system substrate-binding protein
MLCRFVGFACLCLSLLGACSKEPSDAPSVGDGSAAAKTKVLKIAVIPKGTTHEFWKAVRAGAVKASRELKVAVTYKGPLKEDDLKQQIDLVQNFTAQKVDGIVLAPLNDKALRGPVKGAKRSGIPVVVIDSALQGEEHESFVATDNRKAGALAGERMAKLLGEKGGVIVLRYQEGSASTANREKGFIEAIAKHEGVKILSSNRYGGATTESAFKAAENLLAAQGGPDKVAGVFCPNESTTFGMLLALRKTGAAGKIKFVGFDASQKLIGGLKQKHIDALVVQDPFNMGYLGVKTMVQHLRGQPVKKLIDTGAKLVDPGNMDSPAMKELLAPDLKRWLGE